VTTSMTRGYARRGWRRGMAAPQKEGGGRRRCMRGTGYGDEMRVGVQKERNQEASGVGAAACGRRFGDKMCVGVWGKDSLVRAAESGAKLGCQRASGRRGRWAGEREGEHIHRVESSTGKSSPLHTF
jgi:hypothetical protein